MKVEHICPAQWRRDFCERQLIFRKLWIQTHGKCCNFTGDKPRYKTWLACKVVHKCQVSGKRMVAILENRSISHRLSTQLDGIHCSSSQQFIYWPHMLCKYCLVSVWNQLAQGSTKSLSHCHSAWASNIGEDVANLLRPLVKDCMTTWKLGRCLIHDATAFAWFIPISQFGGGGSWRKIPAKKSAFWERSNQCLCSYSCRLSGGNFSPHFVQNSCILRSLRMRIWMWAFAG